MTAMPIAARWVFGQFTSLGDNCEFGLAQRRAGAEPLGLFRLASTNLPGLLAGLADQFADLNPPTPLHVGQPWGDEYITWFGARGFYHHTLLTPADITPAALLLQEATRIPFLRRRLLEDLADGSTIFVHKSQTHDPVGMHTLHHALGGNRLLWVEASPSPDVAGQVQPMGPGLYRGWLDRMAHYGDAASISFDGWLRLCLAVLTSQGVTLPSPQTPPVPRIGVDVPMGGWDGVTCSPGGPPPLHPAGQVFTHTTEPARACCGAVLNPRPPLSPGQAVVASVYVWLPDAFHGRQVAPVLTHVSHTLRLPAVLADRNRWQRLWVSGVVPDNATGVDFGLWLDLAQGDVFHTTEWTIQAGTTPADYWLQP